MSKLERFDGFVVAAFALLGAVAAAATVSAHRDMRPTLAALSVENIPKSRSATFYAAAYSLAAEDENWAVAHALAKAETNVAPDRHTAWQRLAHADAAAQGTPGTEALRAYIMSSQIAPYPPPADMRWRVEFAQAYWPAMPNIVQSIVIDHISVLGRMPQTWRVREAWCQNFSVAALKTAACETLGGNDPAAN